MAVTTLYSIWPYTQCKELLIEKTFLLEKTDCIYVRINSLNKKTKLAHVISLIVFLEGYEEEPWANIKEDRTSRVFR